MRKKKRRRRQPPVPDAPRADVVANLQQRFTQSQSLVHVPDDISGGFDDLPEEPIAPEEAPAPSSSATPPRTASSVVGTQERTGACGMPFSFDEASRDGFTNIWSKPEVANAFEMNCEEYDDTSMPATMFSDRFRAAEGGPPAQKKARRQ